MLQYGCIDYVPLCLVREAEEERLLSWSTIPVTLLELKLHADFQQLEASTEELGEAGDLEVDHLFVIEVVVRLEVESSIGHIENSIDFYQW